MPVCETCDGEDYEEIDGFFYCTTCQTQSQAFRVEEIEDEFAPRPSNTLEIKSSKSQSKSKREDKEKDLGRPWHTYEAFQKIIKEQVKSLIKLGADPALKNVVFKFWCRYLSFTGIAFPEDLDKQKDLFAGYQRQREVYPATIENPVIPPVRYRKTHLQRFGMSAKKSKQKQEKQEMKEALRNEEFYEGDNPLEDNPSESSDIEEEEDLEENRTNLIQEDSVRKTIQWMSMNRALCFCFLGLRKMKCLVTASDIVRWVKQGHIPYLQATKILPNDMKFSSADNKAFTTKVPTVEEINKTTERLLNFLQEDDAEVSVPTSILISKNLVLLNLPGELHGFVQRLHLMRADNINIESGEECNVNNEVIAMMCIITTLQLLLGLNDKMEWELSKCAKKLMEMPGFNHTLFCWEQWVSYTSIHSLSGTYSKVLTNQFDPRSIKDVQKYMEEVKSLKLNVRKMCKDARSSCENKINQEETVAAIRRPVYLLQEEIQKNYQKQVKPQSDRDFLSSKYAEEDPLGYMMGEYDNEISENTELETVSFKSYSLKYITQPRSFVKALENCGLDDSTIYSSCFESSDEDIQEDLENAETLTQSRKRKRRKEKEEMREKLSKVIDFSQSEESKFDTKKLIEISDMVICVQESFPLFDPMDIVTNQSASLQWLIQVCAGVIQCSVESLRTELVKFQATMFGKEDFNSRDRSEFLHNIANK
ncbi:TATA box-binding protein-associated factor RNA polymerase I subunit B-like [Saccostrea echinata]|uniref:TATA box-binding protein-associated factor RNA polymerase I subunit B-like n=1 Tax=Saccostrea echinata TaxID=191078 RepID=UPI002A7F9895|nr:TATA box-binding protein-associated factor RNA polymerase I subunit B-like [Saccostrea echinata]